VTLHLEDNGRLHRANEENIVHGVRSSEGEVKLIAVAVPPEWMSNWNDTYWRQKDPLAFNKWGEVVILDERVMELRTRKLC
jgi:hypothetical protein